MTGWQLWGTEDIRNAILAAEEAGTLAGASDEYLTGYLSALRVLALAFGLDLPERTAWEVQGAPELIEGRVYERTELP